MSTDLYGGHFRAGNPQQRAEQRAFELGFVLDALEVEVAEEDSDGAAPGAGHVTTVRTTVDVS